MNKVLNINLGGYAFTIDDDAFEYLSNYLDSVRRRFSESDGRDEIVSDIETRLGELISADMRNRTIVMLPDVEAAVQIMGKPEDFEGADDAATSTSGTKSGAGSTTTGTFSSIKTGKRLFRDEEDKVVSGVCSGLAAYFGVQDPVWVRLLFVLLAFISGGFWIPAYILFSWIVPPAKTAADRLSMRGEPINVDSIAQEIEKGMNQFGEQINNLGDRINKEGKYKGVGHGAISNGMTALGQAFTMMLRFLGKSGLLIGGLIAIVLFLALAASWIGGVVGLVTAAPYITYFSPYSNAGNWLGFSNGFFLLGIPIVGLVLTFSRVFLKTRAPRWLGPTLGIFWTFNLISAIGLGIFGAKGFRQSSTLTQTIDLSNIASDTLRITADQIIGDSDDSFWIDGTGVHTGDDEKLNIKGMIDIRVKRSEGGRFVCTQAITARGATNIEASENAARTNFNVTVDGSTLHVPNGYSIPKGQKWRVQQVKINLEVPNGKCVVFDENIYERAAADVELYADDNDRNYISRRPGKIFCMTEDGLLCADCPKFGDKAFKSERDFENFILEGNFTAEIRKSEESGFSYKIEGAGADAVKVVKTGDRITFTTNGKPANNVHLILEAQVFTSLIADNTGLVTIRGFEEGRASITAKGSSQVKGNFDVSNLKVVLSGPSRLELDGEGNELDAVLSGGAVLEAPAFRLERANMVASDGSRATVTVSDRVKKVSDASSVIKVIGNAEEE
jgi:phage shock protein C